MNASRARREQAQDASLIVTCRHADVLAAVFFQQTQAALLELALALLGRRLGGHGGNGPLLLDHHHAQLPLEEVDLPLGQLLFALLQVLLLDLLLEHRLPQFLFSTPQLLNHE